MISFFRKSGVTRPSPWRQEAMPFIPRFRSALATVLWIACSMCVRAENGIVFSPVEYSPAEYSPAEETAVRRVELRPPGNAPVPALQSPQQPVYVQAARPADEPAWTKPARPTLSETVHVDLAQAEDRPRGNEKQDAEEAADENTKADKPGEIEGIDLGFDSIGQIGATVGGGANPEYKLPPDRMPATASAWGNGPPTPPTTLLGPSVATGYFREGLYFEDTNLERYGTGPKRAAIYSAAKFYATVPILPYKSTLEPAGHTYYYGHPYQAGRYGCRERAVPPANAKAGLVEAATIVGAVLLIP